MQFLPYSSRLTCNTLLTREMRWRIASQSTGFGATNSSVVVTTSGKLLLALPLPAQNAAEQDGQQEAEEKGGMKVPIDGRQCEPSFPRNAMFSFGGGGRGRECAFASRHRGRRA